MAKYTSGRQKNLKVGIQSYSENLTSLEVIGNSSITGIITANIYYGEGGKLRLGIPTDGSLTSSGALNTFTGSTNISNGIDELNELAFNIIKNTAVTDVDFSSNLVQGGSPLSITLSVTSSGNANRYDVNWGDGTETLDYNSSSIPHTYTESLGGQFSIALTAKNNSGVGAGSSYSISKDNYITVYTSDPVVSFDLYRNSSGGSALSGNDLYVIEGQSLYMSNVTTNTSSATVDYTMNWGDGSSNDSIADDNSAGGVSGIRLQHTWADGSNTSVGRDTLTLTLNNHSTAYPAIIPSDGTLLLKVYNDSPSTPDGLSSKTLLNVTSVGTSPKLAHGFSDNTGGTSLIAGDDVNRIISGTAEATALSSFSYNADSGNLTANVNGSSDGSVSLTSSDDSGTYSSLIITEESDYQLLNSSGLTTTFASSIYYPGLYKGFKAKVSKSVSGLGTGVNSMQLLHTITGNTNLVEFVKDDLTTSPSVDVSGASLSENVAGTYRYISGIPYYNSGSPSLTLSGVSVSDLVGQCYTNQTNIVDVDTGTNQEGTSSSAIPNTEYTYSQIDNASSSMLNGGVPVVNVGTSSPYTIGDLTVPITSSSVRTIDRIKVRAKNVNGISSYSNDISTNIQVHTLAQSGISEVSIDVSPSLGDGTYTDNAKRIFDFSAETTDTPSYNGSTNFYTNNPYTESSDPGVSGTKEATIRLGVLKHDTTNYSSGYLPVGPDRSGDTGTQYFTFAFRRKVVSNFNINITSSTGVSGVWIAAPGTSIDSISGSNGWLRTDIVYAGSGIPGSGVGGNGSDGCAVNSGDRIVPSSPLSGSYTMTLGTINMSNSTGNVVLVRISLSSGQSISSLSIGAAT